MKNTSKYITIGILLLGIGLSGCSMFSMSTMRAVVIDKDASVYGTIEGETYKVRDMDGNIKNVKFKEDWYIVNDAALVKVEERKNRRFVKGIKLTKRNKMMGGSAIAIITLLLRLLALKRKMDKGEEVDWTDIVKIFKRKKRKK